MQRPTRTPPVRPYGGIAASERVANRRETLLAAGLELFGTQGVAATRVKDVCRQAELTDRYFYESFANTGQLFVAVFDRVVDELATAVAAAVEQAPGDADAQLRAGIGTYVRLLADDTRMLRVVFSEAHGAGPEAEQHLREGRHRFSLLVAEAARRNLRVVLPDAMLRVLALSLVGTVEQVLVEWQDGRLELAVDGIIDHIVRLYRAVLLAAEAGELDLDTGAERAGAPRREA